MSLGGGLFARAHAVATDDPATVLVLVSVGASAKAGLSTDGAHDLGTGGEGEDAPQIGLGLSGSLAGRATSTLGRRVPHDAA